MNNDYLENNLIINSDCSGGVAHGSGQCSGKITHAFHMFHLAHAASSLAAKPVSVA